MDSKNEKPSELLCAVLRYKRACKAAKACTELLLSDGADKKATELMIELMNARKELFDIVGA